MEIQTLVKLSQFPKVLSQNVTLNKVFGFGFLLYFLRPFIWGLFSTGISLRLSLKGVFAKNERGYRLNAIKKRF